MVRYTLKAPRTIDSGMDKRCRRNGAGDLDHFLVASSISFSPLGCTGPAKKGKGSHLQDSKKSRIRE
jgi:hypothetical protein